VGEILYNTKDSGRDAFLPYGLLISGPTDWVGRPLSCFSSSIDVNSQRESFQPFFSALELLC